MICSLFIEAHGTEKLAVELKGEFHPKTIFASVISVRKELCNFSFSTVRNKWKAVVRSLIFIAPLWGQQGTLQLGGVSSSILSVIFTDKFYKLLKSLHLIGWEQICQWKTLTKRLMKCPPGVCWCHRRGGHLCVRAVCIHAKLHTFLQETPLYRLQSNFSAMIFSSSTLKDWCH